jgi:colanic acid/amylovoran biosynthesis glycosyltransferase
VRIAVLTSEFPSVSETFVLQHVADLVARGHEVDVFPERAPAAAVDHPELRGGALLERRHLPPPMPRARLARLLGAARLALRAGGGAAPLLRSLNPLAFGRHGTSLALLYRQQPFLPPRAYDVVHCHHGPVALTALRLRRLGVLSGALVASFHGHDANVAPRAGGPRMYAPLFRDARLLLANSEFLRGRLLALGAPPERVVRHPVAVRVEDFAAARPDLARDGELRVVSVARLVEAKGIDVALRAVARLAPLHPGLRYRVAGEGPERARLERLAAELGIARRVAFLGALPHDAVARLLAGANVFCLPSVVGRDGSQEAQGLALVEAQASGLPVVASAIGGVPESLCGGVSGELVPARDPEALARALGALLASPERRAAMGAAGRAFAVRHFDRRVWAERLERHYREIAARRAAPPARASAPGLRAPA